MNEQERQQYRKAHIRRLHQIIDESYNELTAWKTEERLEQNADKVGKCYRYRNSSFHKEAYWYYLQVTDMDEDGCLTGWAFERDSEDRIFIYLSTPYKDHLSNYEEIPSEQFWTVWQDIKAELVMLTTKATLVNKC